MRQHAPPRPACLHRWLAQLVELVMHGPVVNPAATSTRAEPRKGSETGVAETTGKRAATTDGSLLAPDLTCDQLEALLPVLVHWGLHSHALTLWEHAFAAGWTPTPAAWRQASD
jgi:hypothetical protein